MANKMVTRDTPNADLRNQLVNQLEQLGRACAPDLATRIVCSGLSVDEVRKKLERELASLANEGVVRVVTEKKIKFPAPVYELAH